MLVGVALLDAGQRIGLKRLGMVLRIVLLVHTKAQPTRRRSCCALFVHMFILLSDARFVRGYILARGM